MTRTDRMSHDANIAAVIAGWILCGGVAGWAASLIAARFVATPVPASRRIAIIGGAILTPWALALSAGAPTFVASLFLVTMLLALTIIDLAILRLPDLLTLPLIVMGLVIAPFTDGDLVSRLIGAVLGYAAIAVVALVFRRATGRDGIGLGDAKLLAGAGAWLGWAALPSLLLIACGVAFGWVFARAIAQGRRGLTAPIPFGPPLALAFLAGWTARLAGWL